MEEELTEIELAELEAKAERKRQRKEQRDLVLARRVPDSTIDKKNTFYNGNPKLKKAGISLPFTQAQIEEYVKCKNDILYFIKTYCQIVSLDEGLIPFELYPFQEEMITCFKENRFSISLCSRQSRHPYFAK